MFTAIFGIVGFLLNHISTVTSYFQDKNDKAQELAIMQLQVTMAQINAKANLAEVEIGAHAAVDTAVLQADTAQQQAMYKTYNTGIKSVDKFNGFVRPIITYCMFLLYLSVKVPCLVLAWYDVQNGTGFSASLMSSLWSEEDAAIFAGIIGFYFGSMHVQMMKEGSL